MRFLFFISFVVFFSFANAQIFSDGETGLIPDSSPWQSFELEVDDVGIINCNIKLCVDITHTYVGNLRIRLEAPNGLRRWVVRNEGSSGDNFTNTCFTMDADQEIVEIYSWEDPFTGDYVPEELNGTFDDFVGIDANGTWKLQIRDNLGYPNLLQNWSDGFLNSWLLDFTCDEPCDEDEGQLEYTLSLTDSYGDGWNGGYLTIDGIDYTQADITPGLVTPGLAPEEEIFIICLDSSLCYDITYTAGTYDDEVGWTITDNSGSVLNSGAGGVASSDNFPGSEFACSIFGCTDNLACNFNSLATDDDGSCEYVDGPCESCVDGIVVSNEGQLEYTLNLFDSYGDGWYASYFVSNTHLVEVNGITYGADFNAGSIDNIGLYEISYSLCLDPADCIDISFIDNGLFEGECSFNIINSSGEIVFTGDEDTENENFGDCAVEGCIDPLACNYDSDAEEDDGSCFFNPLTVDECEVVYCDSESGEQFAPYTANFEYLTIPINGSGTLNELYYDINWHDQGVCDELGIVGAGVSIQLLDQNNQLVNTLVNLNQPCPVPNYFNFTSTDSYDLSVDSGYYIQVEAWTYGYLNWQSYINLANISFTVETSISPSQITPN